MLEGLMSDEGVVSHAIRPNPGKRKTRMLTSMDDFPAVQVSQTIQYAVGNLGEDLLARSATKFLDFLVDTIQTSTLAKLHGDGDSARGLVHEGSVVATDMIGRAVLVEIELANNLLFHVRVRVCSDDLQRTDMISRYRQRRLLHHRIQEWLAYLQSEYSLAVLEPAAGDGAARTLAQAAQLYNLLLFAGRMPALIIQVLHIQRPALLQTQLVQVWEERIHASVLHTGLADGRGRVRAAVGFAKASGDIDRRVGGGGAWAASPPVQRGLSIHPKATSRQGGEGRSGAGPRGGLLRAILVVHGRRETKLRRGRAGGLLEGLESRGPGGGTIAIDGFGVGGGWDAQGELRSSGAAVVAAVAGHGGTKKRDGGRHGEIVLPIPGQKQLVGVSQGSHNVEKTRVPLAG